MTDLPNLFQESRDTSPLDLEQLSDDELAMILSIERRLYEAQRYTGVERHSGEGSESYLAEVERRHPRVLLLDGGRGTGKTSVLLTLVDRWHGWSRSGVAETATYRERVAQIRQNSKFTPGEHDFDIPAHVRVVGILDFDPLPPEMPLVAGIMQAWRPLAERYDELSGRLADCDDEGDTLMDLWHRLFRVAAVGWTAISKDSGLIEQVLDREEQVQDWQRLDKQWRKFVDEVIGLGKCLKGAHKLADQPVFVIMIDDVDLQVGRIRELLPALRLLYHPKVVFLVAADRRHMVDMLKLDFLGQQNVIATRQLREDALQVSERDRWAGDLARSSFQKVFPLRNRWYLRPLSLRELLEFPEASANLRTVLNESPLSRSGSDPSKTLAVGDYLHTMGIAADDIGDLPPVMTYRTAHQIFHQVSSHNVPPSGSLEAIRQMLGASDADDLVRTTERGGRGHIVEYRLIGELAALFRPDFVEPISGQADIVLSARPEFIYRRDPSSNAILMTGNSDNVLNFTAALAAVSMRDDGYGVTASGLRWDVRLALAWTRVRLFDRVHQDPNLDLAFQWRFQEHPSPKRLLEWTREWARFVHDLHASTEQRLDRIAYAWIYYHLRNLGASMDGVPEPFSDEFNTSDAWTAILQAEPQTGTAVERARWRTQTLPLLARPEIGLHPDVQERLLQFVGEDPDFALGLWDHRRRLVTDAILAAADEARVPAEEAEDSARVARAIEVFERRHRDIYRVDSPWFRSVEVHVQQSRGDALPAGSS
ncbi:MAG TPA: hypothetical protein VNJ70_08085 [Thermoanaerobaculia bacterium]|nr:hypothetical protein [Thermoanaerobaculia bacterium]